MAADHLRILYKTEYAVNGVLINKQFERRGDKEGAVQKERTALIIFKDKRFVLC